MELGRDALFLWHIWLRIWQFYHLKIAGCWGGGRQLGAHVGLFLSPGGNVVWGRAVSVGKDETIRGRIELGAPYVALNRLLGVRGVISSNNRTGCFLRRRTSRVLIGKRRRGEHKGGLCPKSRIIITSRNGFIVGTKR